MKPPRTLATLLAVPLLLGGCGGPSGVADAGEVEAFSTCVESAGVSLDGSDDWDAEEQLAFWAEHGPLSCAVTELDEDQLVEALDGSLSEEPDDDDPAVRDGQQAAVLVLATDTARAEGEDAAVAAVAAVVDAGWFEDEDDSLDVRRLAALGILVAAGETPEYADYRQRNADSTVDDLGLDVRYAYDLWNRNVETDEVTDRQHDLAARIADLV